jgi:hypothetical protein
MDEQVRADMRQGARPTMRMLTQHGALDDPVVRTAFRRRRLV